MRSSWLVLLLLLGGCTRTAAPDSVLAETHAPVHLAVRRVANPIHDCAVGSVFERAQCRLFDNPEIGCVYLEFVPASGLLPLARCDRVQGRDEVFPLENAPLVSAKLVAEPRGERVLIDLGATGLTVMSWRGVTVGIAREWPDHGPRENFVEVDGTPRWLELRSVLGELDRTEFQLTPAELDSLISRTSEPMEKLVKALHDSIFRYRPDAGFDVAASRLDEEHQQVLRVNLEQELATGTRGARLWFAAHPEERDQAWAEALLDAVDVGKLEEKDLFADLRGADAAAVRRAMVHGAVTGNAVAAAWVHRQGGDQRDYLEALLNSLSVVPGTETFTELRRRAPEVAAAKACAVLGETVQREDLGLPGILRVQLALIVAQKTKCPAAQRLLERMRCDEELSCGNEGGALCTPAQRTAALQRMIDGAWEGDDWAPLLLSAASAVGPPPPEPAAGCSR